MYEIKLRAESETTTFRFYSKQKANQVLAKLNGNFETDKQNYIRPTMTAA